MSKLHPKLRPYAVSILSVCAATVVTLAIAPLFGGKAPLFFFTIAVIISASFGLLPGLAATALSIVSVSLLFREIFTLVLAHSSLPLFALVGAGISIMMGRLHKANAALLETKEALQHANERLSERSRALALANEELQKFAYALAHDLNAPMRSIRTLTELLAKRNSSNFDENSKECADLIVSRAHRMQSMIDGLLHYAAAVDKPAEKVRTNISEVVHRSLQDLDAMIHTSGAEVKVDNPLPCVDAVESQLVQVFSNLIGNGIKYCPHGQKPQIQISAREHSDEYIISVTDNGIGIDMQYAETIFGMFQRLHTEEYEGSGIGLALCKAVVERHGGRIWVESKPGDGSNFCFTLPKSPSRLVLSEVVEHPLHESKVVGSQSSALRFS